MRTFNCLIVDDEPIARDIVQTYCAHLPYLRVTASCGNAVEAKLILQPESIDILFLDINMPVMNGISLLSTLRQPHRSFLQRPTSSTQLMLLILLPAITC